MILDRAVLMKMPNVVTLILFSAVLLAPVSGEGQSDGTSQTDDQDAMTSLLMEILQQRNAMPGYNYYLQAAPAAAFGRRLLLPAELVPYQVKKKSNWQYYGNRRINTRVPSFGSKIFPSEHVDESGHAVFRYG